MTDSSLVCIRKPSLTSVIFALVQNKVVQELGKGFPSAIHFLRIMGPTPLPPSTAPAKAALLGQRMFKRESGLSRFLDLPLLRKQKSFTDEITLSNPGSLDATAISLWENRA